VIQRRDELRVTIPNRPRVADGGHAEGILRDRVGQGGCRAIEWRIVDWLARASYEQG
jgi:hypothetical protein